MEDVVNPWQGRRVLITGHTGFKGGWLTLWLAARGAVLKGFALDPDTDPNLYTIARVGDKIEDVRGDIRDYHQIKKAVVEFAPDVVLHLAAQPLVRRSYQEPLATYNTNVMGTAHVLEAVRECSSVRAVVCVTTDKCYQNQEWDWPYRETDPLGGADPYASSKACSEIVAAAYRASFFSRNSARDHQVGLATARAGNVIGGGDWSQDRLVPDLIHGFQTQQPVLIRRPNAVRPWQHVLEAIRGYIVLAERLLQDPARFSSAYNFGPDETDTRSVEQIATNLASIWGEGASWINDSSPGVHEANMLRLDSSKAKSRLNWAPCLPLDTSLRWIVQWHRARLAGHDMRLETIRQIQEYWKIVEHASGIPCGGGDQGCRN